MQLYLAIDEYPEFHWKRLNPPPPAKHYIFLYLALKGSSFLNFFCGIKVKFFCRIDIESNVVSRIPTLETCWSIPERNMNTLTQRWTTKGQRSVQYQLTRKERKGSDWVIIYLYIQYISSGILKIHRQFSSPKFYLFIYLFSFIWIPGSRNCCFCFFLIGQN